MYRHLEELAATMQVAVAALAQAIQHNGKSLTITENALATVREARALLTEYQDLLTFINEHTNCCPVCGVVQIEKTIHESECRLARALGLAMRPSNERLLG